MTYAQPRTMRFSHASLALTRSYQSSPSGDPSTFRLRFFFLSLAAAGDAVGEAGSSMTTAAFRRARAGVGGAGAGSGDRGGGIGEVSSITTKSSNVSAVAAVGSARAGGSGAGFRMAPQIGHFTARPACSSAMRSDFPQWQLRVIGMSAAGLANGHQ